MINIPLEEISQRYTETKKDEIEGFVPIDEDCGKVKMDNECQDCPCVVECHENNGG